MPEPFALSVAWQAAALAAALGPFALIELGYARSFGREHRADDRCSSEALAAATLLNLMAAPALAYWGLGALPARFEVWGAGLMIALAGTALRYWAIRTLGRRFTSAVVVADGHELERRGPYRLVRHPAYSGALMFGVGVALLLGSWLAGAVFLATYGAAVVYRVRVEEAAMHRMLGEAYAEFARETPWRVVPFVY